MIARSRQTECFVRRPLPEEAGRPDSRRLTHAISPQPYQVVDRVSRRAVLLAGTAVATTVAADCRSQTMLARDMQRDVALKGFDYRRITTAGATINVATRGKGAPLLLLHGYPETHHCWHKVAPALAEEFTVVCPDLRGYGDSSKPEGAPDHTNYSKRAMAEDMI